MIEWISDHLAVSFAVAILAAFAFICLMVALEHLADWLEARQAAPAEDSGAPEGGNPTVRMPRFR